MKIFIKPVLNKKFIIKRTLVLIGVCLLMWGISFIISDPVAKEAITTATTIKPEKFSELYFEDHINLPKTIIPLKEYSFTFTLHNLEYQDMVYPYVVYLTTFEKKIILYEGIIRLKHNEYWSQREDYGPLKSIRMKITVELIDKNQSISFWMDTL
jgi:hypothetical protein